MDQRYDVPKFLCSNLLGYSIKDLTKTPQSPTFKMNRSQTLNLAHELKGSSQKGHFGLANTLNRGYSIKDSTKTPQGLTFKMNRSQTVHYLNLSA